MNGVLDSLKTVSISGGGMWVTWMEWLPVAVRVAVGIMTLAYMFYKTKNEWLKYVQTEKKGSSKK